ncbi:MAG: transglutaminase-like cysteine peptidase [Hyphomicrobium sp.]|uniref:transglutaminase-like cysteine peptidase n=1 Tax=Hyphomicrobium sp. TaxID=82 RepID=UPI0039E5A495
MRILYSAFAGCVAMFVAAVAHADESGAIARPVMQNLFLPEYGKVEPPPAFKRFCVETPDECVFRSPAKDFKQLAKSLEQLDEVNRRINRAIVPETDIEHYGIEDYWTIPKDGKGDCEDYALLKRHILISLGWPSSALLMTVVRIENGEGHAVLTARTRFGDVILDNRTDELRSWYQTPYSYKMIQSSNDPKIWRDLDPNDDVMPAPIAVPQFLYDLTHPR